MRLLTRFYGILICRSGTIFNECTYNIYKCMYIIRTQLGKVHSTGLGCTVYVNAVL